MGLETQNSIEAFAGWEEADSIDLFAAAPAVEEEIDILKTVIEDDSVEKEKTSKDKKETVIAEEDLFSFVEKENDDEEDEEKDKPKPVEKLSSSALLSSLKERGLVQYELEEGVELDDETADEILEDSFEERLEAIIEEKFSGLDPRVKDIVRHSISGGNFDGLLSKLTTPTGIKITEDMDLEDEKNQIAVITRDRLAKGEDAESIATYTDYLKDAGKLKGQAEVLHKSFIEKDKVVAKAEADRLIQANKLKKQEEREYKTSLATLLNTEKDINGVKFTKQELAEYPSYIADANIELEGGRKISGLHKDLYLAMKDEKKILLLAKILKDDFNFTDISTAERSKQVRDIKGNLQRSKTATSVTNKKTKKALASYFD